MCNGYTSVYRVNGVIKVGVEFRGILVITTAHVKGVNNCQFFPAVQKGREEETHDMMEGILG